MSVIEIKNFSKKYGNFTAVKSINLSIPQGLIVGFVGKNGAGKSTTLRSMLNMINVTSGSVSILNMDSKKDTKEIKRRVSYIPSEASFYDNITCERLLLFAAGFTNTPTEEIKKLADYFELDLTKKIDELSFGNKKKLSLIQGFLKQCEVMVLDEPTNGLDPLMQDKFFELLLKEKAQGRTIFLSSHNLGEIEKYCDKVAIIKDGELVDFFDMQDVKIKHKQLVSYTTKDGVSESFELDTDINELIKKLSTIDLESLEIKTKSVQEEFIGYYKEKSDEKR